MENRTRAEIGERTKGVVEHEEKQRWIDAIDRHLIDGTDAYVGLYTEEQYQEFAALLGHEKISSDMIIAYSYEATANESLSENGEALPFNGRYTIAEIQNRVADYGVNLEFPNNFKTSLVVALDAESMVTYRFELNSEGVVCEACATSQDPEIIEELELNEHTGYGCGHEDDVYHSRYGATITQRTTAAEFFKGSDNWW